MLKLDKQQVLDSISNFLDLDSWKWLHLKAEGKFGSRELLLNNVMPVPPVVEPTEIRVLKVLYGLKNGQSPQGVDGEWFQAIQGHLSQGGSKPQISSADTYEEAIQKVKEAGIQ